MSDSSLLSRIRTGGFALVMLAGVFTGGAARAEVKVGGWTPIFQGVEFATGEADEKEPRLQKAFAVRVDLRAPGIEFLATPDNGDAPLETTSETPNDFLVRHKLQVAINANFYEPCCEPGNKNLLGLAMSRGVLVSPPAATGTGAAVLLITRDNHATITTTAKPIAVEKYWTAVAGSERVLIDGVKPVFKPTKFNTTEHPRSAVGISKDGRYLILLAIDGRQPGYSIGAPMDDVAAWLLRFGAWQGLNLDGGGSTALVRASEDGPMQLNKVSGAGKPHGDQSDFEVVKRVQRSNGNHLGVFARPLARR
ncbi:phosphodiester glycosidase family protein [Opitutus sp. ER46]|uniref:phosphodiester glycosidase family protein n=1 Tax=Opitutus sp. ER46 TaxID=2161864 RepID=UPI000D2F95E3|nr:phosphodiester glycosidase family protein [Opitutus sp. ER46]PTX97883.1 hypothetical protein DB354_06280 [Opitutus sp. ER46]